MSLFIEINKSGSGGKKDAEFGFTHSRSIYGRNRNNSAVAGWHSGHINLVSREDHESKEQKRR